MSIKTLIVIVGPTGSGKTDLSIAVAEHFSAPIISTDSRQFYRGIPIGTAKPDAEQLQRVEHHFIASHDLTDEFNCGAYEVAALKRLEELFLQHDTVVAVGGSGLYVKALCEGMDDMPEVDAELRQRLSERLQAEGLESLVEELRQRDAEFYEVVDRKNPARVLRALEVCIATGKPYSSLRTGTKRKRDFNIVKIGTDMPRDILYDRIDRRVDMMIEQGLEAEARSVYHLREHNSLQTVGYREMFDYFDGKISREEAIELIKRNSRRYAKRQLTWFRRDSEIGWFHPADKGAIIDYLEAKICTLK
ncbi:MAG: tRNA (adenosine(37)-N6)-dimethylallyltransferase MiaA [Rikenellaceae bacterium]|nr:tRNA (adenosine(37)-N6)-dimethylallyltransferase MiaA [Rikenellaceae bacterium]